MNQNNEKEYKLADALAKTNILEMKLDDGIASG